MSESTQKGRKRREAGVEDDESDEESFMLGSAQLMGRCGCWCFAWGYSPFTAQQISFLVLSPSCIPRLLFLFRACNHRCFRADAGLNSVSCILVSHAVCVSHFMRSTRSNKSALHSLTCPLYEFRSFFRELHEYS